MLLFKPILLHLSLEPRNAGHRLPQKGHVGVQRVARAGHASMPIELSSEWAVFESPASQQRLARLGQDKGGRRAEHRLGSWAQRKVQVAILQGQETLWDQGSSVRGA